MASQRLEGLPKLHQDCECMFVYIIVQDLGILSPHAIVTAMLVRPCLQLYYSKLEGSSRYFVYSIPRFQPIA